MSLDFWQMKQGKHLIEDSIPRLVTALEKIAFAMTHHLEDAMADADRLRVENASLRDQLGEATNEKHAAIVTRDRVQTELIDARARLGEIDKTRPLTYYENDKT